MFKAIIDEKKRQAFEQNKTDVFKDISCVDCSKKGHYTKVYHKCEFYEPKTVEQVGTAGKKRKQGSQIKNEKKRARLQGAESSTQQTSICDRCKQTGHTSARSPLCPHHIPKKTEVFRLNLGDNYRAFTRKILLDSCVMDEYRTELKAKITEACSSVRCLIFKAKLFVNYYIIENSTTGVPKCLLTQNFWYSIIQLINEKNYKSK